MSFGNHGDREIKMLPPGKKNMIRRKKQMYLQNQSEDMVQLSLRTQDEAVVVSASFHFEGIKEKISQIFRGEMEKLSESIEADGGLVGHIKASLEFKEIEVISVTAGCADVRRGDFCEISGSFAAILLLIDETTAYTKTEEMFKTIKNQIIESKKIETKEEI